MFISSILFSLTVFTQIEPEDSLVVEPEECVLIDLCETEPEYYGGWQSLLKFLNQNLTIPDDQDFWDAVVYVEFVVDKTGEVRDEKIVRGINDEVDSEVLRVVKLMPDWFPGTYGSKAISVRYTLPIKIHQR
mgnify:CR=1 FL=1